MGGRQSLSSASLVVLLLVLDEQIELALHAVQALPVFVDVGFDLLDVFLLGDLPLLVRLLLASKASLLTRRPTDSSSLANRARIAP